MFEQPRDEESGVYVPPPDDQQRDADATDDPLPEYQETTVFPVWLRESSKSFRWGWMPLPFRKAGWAVVRWVKGPVPPRTLLLKPLFPRLQELPAHYLNRLFPKRWHKIVLLLLLYVSWFLPWFLVMFHARTSGYIEGYGRPQTLSCTSTYWSSSRYVLSALCCLYPVMWDIANATGKSL